MNTHNQYLRDEKVNSIQQEFHEFNDMEIQPGYRVNDLITRDQCSRAVVLLTSEIDNIVIQLSKARLDYAKGLRQIDADWQMRAQNAIRYKRRVIKAIRAKHECIPPAPRRDEFRKCLIDVISEDIGSERMSEYAEEARRRFPDMARPVDAVQGEEKADV